MNRILKYAGAATLTAALALAAVSPSQARDGRNAAAAIGFAAGAVVGAAVASSAYDNGYYYDGYAYDPGYAPGPGYYAPGPAYYDDYAYEGPAYRYHNWRTQGPGCIQSPASHSYTSCN